MSGPCYPYTKDALFAYLPTLYYNPTMAVKTQLEAKIFQALLARLNTMSGGYDIVEPGETYPTSADTAFIVVQDVRFEPDALYIGATSSNENRGMLSLSVMTPLSWSHSQTLGIAGLIRDHFPKSLTLTYSDVQLEILRTPYIDGNAMRDESWKRVNVMVRWRAAG